VKKYRELEADNPLMLAMLQGRILDEETDLRDALLSLPIKRRLLIRDEARDIELAPQDIGVGISQVLPVVVAALHQKTGLVAIEQPELHIHPAFQVALGDLFIEQIRQRPDLIFILETHSEHLMLRFLRRIRETGENEAPEKQSLTPAELSVYFIEQGESGISCLPIRVDEDGDFIDRWPKGFFNERVKELY
jgi:predicted ATPase